MTLDYFGQLHKTVDLIRKANHIVVFTGAGISTPSGIADFRSPQKGLWTKDDPMEVASLTTFNQNPQKFYSWLQPLAKDIWKAAPNPAHLGLAALESKGILQAVITQNIDGLHQKAGSQKVIELHGSLDRFICQSCHRAYESQQFKSSILDQQKIPRCLHCHRILKPDIILFEEMLPQKAWAEAEHQCNLCDLMMVVGSSLSVYPAASIPEKMIRNHKAVILLNLSPTPLDEAMQIILADDAARIIPDLIQLLFEG
jgi:NAD-dependent deacetylase